jgi:hypothetical protein
MGRFLDAMQTVPPKETINFETHSPIPLPPPAKIVNITTNSKKKGEKNQ